MVRLYPGARANAAQQVIRQTCLSPHFGMIGQQIPTADEAFPFINRAYTRSETPCEANSSPSFSLPRFRELSHSRRHPAKKRRYQLQTLLWSRFLTDEEGAACIAAGVKVRSRPRFGQSGLLAGQQYWVRKDSAHAKVNVKPTKAKTAPQLLQPQRVIRSTSGPHRGISVAPPDPHPLGTQRGLHKKCDFNR
jgi:hypothetical protein